MVAIVGRPNVGKSTLFNRLSRARNALVDDHPGLTRDRISAVVSLAGTPVTLVDTGGFDNDDTDSLLGKVRDQVAQAVASAEAVLFLVDGREGPLPGDDMLADLLRRAQKPVFAVVNKIDGPEHEAAALEFYGLGFPEVLGVSAKSGYGIRRLSERLAERLPGPETPPETDPALRLAVLGRPNVGKSSLVNRVLGSERVLVSDMPGTTRDSIDTRVSWRGSDYLLIDTAGIRRKARVRDKIEKFSMIKALRSLDRCHIAIVLLDAGQGISEQDARICGYALERGRGIILAVNKWDLVKKDPRARERLTMEMDRQLQHVSFAPRVFLSALTGERVPTLFDRIQTLAEQYTRRSATPKVNQVIAHIMEHHPAPVTAKGRLKLFYATQTRNKPPTFVIFVNRPDLVHFSYERYVINQLRSRLDLPNTPIRVQFRKK